MDATIVPKMQKHYPVLLKEIISVISPQHGGTFIDCTFGQGGYSKKILDFKNTKVIALDRDKESAKIANQLKENNLESTDIKKFWLHQANARMINLIVSKIIGTNDFDTSLAPLPIEKFGNLASAGSMFAFNLHNDLESGEKGLICSFGAGYSVCSIIVEKI